MIKSSRSRRLLAMSAVATMGGLGAITVTAPQAEAVTCKAYTTISVRGTNDGTRTSSGTQLPTAVAAFKAQKGSTNVVSTYVNYQASFNYAASMADGRAALKATFNSYANACPRTKIALFGYSQGAHIVGDVVVGMSSTQRARLQGIGLIGDPMMNPTFASSKTADRSHGGMWGRRASWPSGVYVYNVCNRGDRVCASLNWVDSMAFLTNGSRNAPHLKYTTSTYSPLSSSGAWNIGYHVARRA